MENLLRLPRERSASRSLSFPLPADAMPSLKVSQIQAAEYREAVTTILDRTVNMERAFRSNPFNNLARGDWKLATEREGLGVYKRMARASEEDALYPMVLCVGTMPGTVEEVLYGLYTETTDQLRAVSEIVHKGGMDSAVLNVLERGTAEDPFHVLALKWRMSGTPGGSLIKNRDSISLESTGIQTDAYGERFGHILLKSVDRPDFPPFSKDIAVRSTIAFCCIFRQVSPTTVGIYAKGTMDLGGDMPDWFSYNFACPRMAGILKTTKCQKAKQLTALAIRHGREFLPTSATKLGLSRVHMSRASKDRSRCADSSSSASSRSRCNSGSLSFLMHFQSSGKHRAVDCALCKKQPSGVLWARGRLQPCQICDRAVCAKCRVKKLLLAVPTNIHAMCCKGCILEANALPVDPHALCPLLYCE